MSQRKNAVSKQLFALAGLVSMFAVAAPAAAQAPRPAAPAPAPAAQALPPGAINAPSDYVIGAGDSLSVKFYKDDLMSADVIVRPDGKITLPILNEVMAAGLTPDQLRAKVTEASAALVVDANIQVYVRDIKSRQVFITGAVSRPNAYPLLTPTSVMQLITLAGGVIDFADTKHIVILRTENGQQVSYEFNYNDVVKRKNLKQNIELKPGDTVIVP